MIHILTGDPFQVEREFQKLQKKLLTGILKDFNFDRFEGRELAASRFLEVCRSLPVMSPIRVVIVRDADGIRKSELEPLAVLFDEKLSQLELIFTAEKLDKRLNFWKRCAEAGKWQEFRPLYPREVPRWILQECRERGLSPIIGEAIDPKAVDWLAGRFSNDLGSISAALEKVSLLGKRGRIDVEDLEATVEGYSWSNIFELTDAVGSKDLKRALRLLRLMSDESPVGLVALIARHFRILGRVKETGEGAPPYFLKNYQQQAAAFTHQKLSGAMEKIFRTDWDLKRSPISQKLVLERLIWELCR